jgi:hypothetical protein
MLIEQNYLDVSYLVIVFFLVKRRTGFCGGTLSIENHDKKIKNQKKKRVIPIKSVDVLLNDSTGYIKSIVLQKPPLKNLKWAC